MVLLRRKLYFSKDPEGVKDFPGGVQMLISIETHITCDFPGGPPQSPPLDPHMPEVFKVSFQDYNLDLYL